MVRKFSIAPVFVPFKIPARRYIGKVRVGLKKPYPHFITAINVSFVLPPYEVCRLYSHSLLTMMVNGRKWYQIPLCRIPQAIVGHPEMRLNLSLRPFRLSPKDKISFDLEWLRKTKFFKQINGEIVLHVV